MIRGLCGKRDRLSLRSRRIRIRLSDRCGRGVGSLRGFGRVGDFGAFRGSGRGVGGVRVFLFGDIAHHSSPSPSSRSLPFRAVSMTTR